MPIKDLTGRIRPQRLGRVRLGRKREVKKGKKTIEIPYATPYFVMDDTPEDVRAIYGEEPTTLKIHFLFNSIPQVFPNYHMFYLQRGLRCMGDGEIVLYRVIGKPEEPIVVIRGAAWAVPLSHLPNGTEEAWLEKYGEAESIANTIACLGFDCPVSQERDCRPTGRLCFAVQDYAAQGYIDMRTGSVNAIGGILGQLELGMAMFGHITDMPWNLHLRPETVQVEGKGLTIYVPWLEIDPKWLQVNLRKRGLHLRAAEEERMGDIADLYGWEEVEDLGYERTPRALLKEAEKEEGQPAVPRPAQEAVEETQAPLEEAKQREESPKGVAPLEGEPPDEPKGPPDGPEVTTTKGNIYERLLADANHNLDRRGYKGRYEGVEEIRQAIEAGGVKGRLFFDKYLDYLIIVIAAKERSG